MVDISGCKNLVEVHDSVGLLENLRMLYANRCIMLSSFPGAIKSKSFELLELSGCLGLPTFPKILGAMENITEVEFVNTF